MTDPITDMLNRIRNAQAVLKETAAVPFSNLKYELARILKKRGFIDKVEKRRRKTKRTILLTLKYENKEPVIKGLKRISKPGRRFYVSTRDIRAVRSGYGLSIISTSKGLMTDKEARKKKLGGEVICEVW